MIVTAIIGTIAIGLPASGNGPPPSKVLTDRLEAWPVAGVMRWPNYNKITSVQTLSTPTTGPPADWAPPDQSPSHPDQRTLDERLSRQAKQEVTRIINMLRPDLVTLLDSAKMHHAAEPHLMSLIFGDPIQSPHLRADVEVSDARVRLTYLYLYADATGKEPRPDRQYTWRTYAQKTLQTVFGRPPKGKRTEQKVTNGYYVNWQPIWKDRPLPRRYWTSFGAVKSGRQWVYAWTNQSTPQQILNAIDSLDHYPANHDHQHAAMVVVKNTAALLPKSIESSSAVWVTSNPHVTGQLDLNWTKLVYHDEARLTAHKRHGPTVPLWQVRIRCHRSSDRDVVVGWVDPANGVLLCLAKVDHPQVSSPGDQ